MGDRALQLSFRLGIPRVAVARVVRLPITRAHLIHAGSVRAQFEVVSRAVVVGLVAVYTVVIWRAVAETGARVAFRIAAILAVDRACVARVRYGAVIGRLAVVT